MFTYLYIKIKAFTNCLFNFLTSVFNIINDTNEYIKKEKYINRKIEINVYFNFS